MCGHEARRYGIAVLSAVVALLVFLAAAGADRRVAEAVKNRDAELVRTLISQHADVNAPLPDGSTALHWAAEWDELETADLLLRADANVNAADDYLVTPVVIAAENGSAALVDRLLKAGANPNTAGEGRSLREEDTVRRRMILALASSSLFAAAFGLFYGRIQGQPSASPGSATPADYARWKTELKNWGRWGSSDQRGASNLITSAKVQNAARLVKSGTVVSLAHAVPQKPEADVPAASVFHRTTSLASDAITVDTYQVSYHGLAVAHMDAFCHFTSDGKMYNGYPSKENITTEGGCQKEDVMAWKEGVVTRAVLYDIPQLKGVQWLEPGTPVTRADLEAWEKKAGVKVGPGDVLMLYVGRWKRRAAQGPWAGQVAGFYADTIPLIRQRDIAFVGHDFNIDWAPRPGWGQPEGIPGIPIHVALLNWLGVGIVENLDLEKAVETARRLNRYEFMLTFAPLPVEGGTGSPINPIAVF